MAHYLPKVVSEMFLVPPWHFLYTGGNSAEYR